jgi:hypothetical protein
MTCDYQRRNPLRRPDSRRATFHTSPHRPHRQYVDASIVFAVVVRLFAAHAGQADGALASATGGLGFFTLLVRAMFGHAFLTGCSTS